MEKKVTATKVAYDIMNRKRSCSNCVMRLKSGWCLANDMESMTCGKSCNYHQMDRSTLEVDGGYDESRC